MVSVVIENIKIYSNVDNFILFIFFYQVKTISAQLPYFPPESCSHIQAYSVPLGIMFAKIIMATAFIIKIQFLRLGSSRVNNDDICENLDCLINL